MTRKTSAPAPPPKARPEGGAGGSPRGPRARLPKSSARRRLKLRHSSSRSGGPWLPPPGPCGPREPRPQLGSFKDMESVRLQSLGFGNRFGSRASRRRPLPGEFDDRVAQSVQACSGARAHENARNPTILGALDPRRELISRADGVDLVPDEQPWRIARRDFGQDAVHLRRLLL